MRTKKTLINLITAFSGQFIGIIVSLIARSVFLNTLGKVYLGVDGLFTNILTLLSLAELGFVGAIIYGLYKPLAEKNEVMIAKLMNLYGFIFKIIGVVVFVLGLTILPFLQYLIKNDTATEFFSLSSLRIYFFIFLLNAVVSYFMAYKRTLIIADQKKYIATILRYSFFTVLNICQIIILKLTQNFVLFLSLQVINTFLENLFVTIFANKLYPFLKKYKKEKLSKEEKKPILKNVKAMFYHKIGGVALSGSNNIIISAFIGLIAVGLYSNYALILVAVNTIVLQFFEAVTASVGNFIATENNEKAYGLFKSIFLLNFWIIGFSSIALIMLLNPFISIWLNESLTFSIEIVALIILNFYLTGMKRTSILFRDVMGLFWHDRYKSIIEAILAIGMAIGLSFVLGVAGVFVGYTLALLLTSFWVEPYILFKYGFNKKVNKYYLSYFYYALILIIAFFLTYFVISLISGSGIVIFILKFFVCLLIPNLIFYIFFRKSKEFKYFVNIILRIIANIKQKAVNN